MNLKYILPFIAFIIALISCAKKEETPKTDKLNVVCTTTMITDLAKQLGGEKINVHGLMGSGVDPHLYKSTESDLRKLTEANLIVYNGLHLEGKMGELFNKLQRNKEVISLGELIPEKERLASSDFASNYDPHIWFSIPLWRKSAQNLSDKFIELDKKNESFYKDNLNQYLIEIDSLEAFIENKINELEPEKRILVSAHDAFGYFGKEYNFQLKPLQGLTTVTEAGTKDVLDLSNYIVNNKIKAIFLESSVPEQTIKALQSSVQAKGYNVQIGGTLYADALGSPNTPEGEYIGMYKYNVNTLVNALK